MGLFKLAVYGAVLGYLAYQAFFAEGGSSLFSGGQSGGSSSSRGNRGGSQSRGGGQGSQSRSGGAQMTGGGEGRTESTQEPGGMSMSHRVGRGVIS